MKLYDFLNEHVKSVIAGLCLIAILAVQVVIITNGDSHNAAESKHDSVEQRVGNRLLMVENSSRITGIEKDLELQSYMIKGIEHHLLMIKEALSLPQNTGVE